MSRSGGIINFVSEKAKLGRNVKIWHFAYVGDGVEIGDNVSIGSLAHVDYGVKIGEGTRIGGLAYIPPLSVIGRNVFIGPATVLTNDRYPPSRRLEGVTVEDGVVIGAKAVVGSGLKIGVNSVVCMGAVVTRDVPPETVVMGVPARPVYSRSEYEAKKAGWERGGG